ncbi:transmembrane protein, putative [Medicago truncatula]|uniref:Transmembrane protein, putative n=1 Tax=Medicago truncatula TaxID=3880 RepID=A0A072UMC7_MEDTR|nr:transmembrane protein, putative [Medicago truncatula]
MAYGFYNALVCGLTTIVSVLIGKHYVRRGLFPVSVEKPKRVSPHIRRRHLGLLRSTGVEIKTIHTPDYELPFTLFDWKVRLESVV